MLRARHNGQRKKRKKVVPRIPKSPAEFDTTGSAAVYHADAMTRYARWPRPTVTVADGPYGLGTFPGEPNTADNLGEWYAPHVAETPLTKHQWERMRAKRNHAHGVTSVWNAPAVRGTKRVKSTGLKALHMNQKPLRLIARTIAASSDPGDVAWEPFGGPCSAAVHSLRSGRHCYTSEVIPDFYAAAVRRLNEKSEIDNTRHAETNKA